MTFNSEVLAEVNVIIETHDVNTGQLIDRQETHNRVTDAGITLIRDLLIGETSDYITHFGFGTGTTAADNGDTVLETEVFRDEVTDWLTGNFGIGDYRYFLSSSSANGNTLTEAGLFTANTDGTLFARVTFNPIVKTSDIALTMFWAIYLRRRNE